MGLEALIFPAPAPVGVAVDSSPVVETDAEGDPLPRIPIDALGAAATGGAAIGARRQATFEGGRIAVRSTASPGAGSAQKEQAQQQDRDAHHPFHVLPLSVHCAGLNCGSATIKRGGVGRSFPPPLNTVSYSKKTIFPARTSPPRWKNSLLPSKGKAKLIAVPARFKIFKSQNV